VEAEFAAANERRSTMQQTKLLQTTLGDLIVALTEEVSRHTPNKRETYTLVASILADILDSCRPGRRPLAKQPAHRIGRLPDGKCVGVSDFFTASGAPLRGNHAG
jgi:hypothetical protein